MTAGSVSETWEALVQRVSEIEAELGRVLDAEAGLGLSEYRALGLLAAAEAEELRMQDLAAALNRNQSSVTRMAERLERAGLTRRDLCPDDKRGVYTVLTAAGKARLEAARPAYEAALRRALADRLSQPGGAALRVVQGR